MTHQFLPLSVGAAMAPMALAALHPAIKDGQGTMAAVAFLGAHIAVVVVFAIGLALCLPRRGRALAVRILSHIRQHAPAMLLGFAVSALIIHLVLHGGIA